MSIERASAVVRELQPVFRSKDAIGAGMSWRELYRLRDSGEIVELSRGVFQVADSDGLERPDFVVVCARAPHAMVCLASALSYWDFTDELPTAVHLAVPAGTTRPTIDYPPTRVHVFDPRTFDLGRLKVADRVPFWITDRERTVVDAFRMRHVLGEDVAFGAVRRYLSSRGKLPRLLAIAREFRVGAPLMTALRVLQA